MGEKLGKWSKQLGCDQGHRPMGGSKQATSTNNGGNQRNPEYSATKAIRRERDFWDRNPKVLSIDEEDNMLNLAAKAAGMPLTGVEDGGTKLMLMLAMVVNQGVEG